MARNININYDMLRGRLLKYKREYEEELKLLHEDFESSSLYIKGHLKMLDILLDDIDSMVKWVDFENISRGEMNSNSFVLDVDLTKENN